MVGLLMPTYEIEFKSLFYLFQVIHLSRSCSQPQGSTPYTMEKIQPSKTPGRTHTIYISYK